MKSASTIWNLNVNHEFYKDGRCKDFKIEPTPDTRAKLAGKRWQYRSESDHLSILSASELFVNRDPLHFSLTVINSDFFHFTDLNYKPGYILWYGCNEKEIETKQYRQVGHSFIYRFEWKNDRPHMLVKTTDGKELFQLKGTYDGHSIVYKQGLPKEITGRLHVLIVEGKKTLHKEVIYVNSEMWAKKTFGVIEILPQKLALSLSLKLKFNSSKESWKFFFISKREEKEAIILRDESKTTENNRYGDLKFSFCERPVQQAIGGNFVTCYETGQLDDNDNFIPQLIPAYEENKRNLSLYRYTFLKESSHQHRHNYYHSRGKKRNPQDDDDSHGDHDDYFYYKCVERNFWDKVLRKHISQKGKKLYFRYKLKKKGIRILSDIQNPSPNKAKKEIYIYL